jgi:hypothetical protein
MATASAPSPPTPGGVTLTIQSRVAAGFASWRISVLPVGEFDFASWRISSLPVGEFDFASWRISVLPVGAFLVCQLVNFDLGCFSSRARIT